MSKLPPRTWLIDGRHYTLPEIGARLGIGPEGARHRIHRAQRRDPLARLTWVLLGLGQHKGVGRIQAICAFVAAAGAPVTLDQVVQAVAAEARAQNPAATVRQIAALLHHLQAKGRLARTGKPRAYVYSATATTLTQTRVGHPRKAAPAPKPPPKRAAAIKPRSASQPAREFVPGPTPAGKPAPPILVRNPALARSQRGELDSDAIAADVAAFLARGGRIERLPNGAASQPTVAFLEAQAAALAQDDFEHFDAGTAADAA